jgi:hypothetical protein
VKCLLNSSKPFEKYSVLSLYLMTCYNREIQIYFLLWESNSFQRDLQVNHHQIDIQPVYPPPHISVAPTICNPYIRDPHIRNPHKCNLDIHNLHICDPNIRNPYMRAPNIRISITRKIYNPNIRNANISVMWILYESKSFGTFPNS